MVATDHEPGGWADGDPGEPTGCLSAMDRFFDEAGDDYAAQQRDEAALDPLW